MIVAALSPRGRDRVFHYTNCVYGKRIDPKNVIYFQSKEEARLCGYRHCKFCARLEKYYLDNKEKIDEYIKEHKLKTYIEDDSMYIENGLVFWKITTSSTGYRLVLYHANSEQISKLKMKDGKLIHHYHKQNYKGHLDILSMLEYIIDHDTWRENNRFSYQSLPRQNKRQKKVYNKEAKKARKKAILNVYNIMDKEKLDREAKNTNKANKKRG